MAVIAPPEIFVAALAAIVALALAELARLRSAGLAAAVELVVIALGTSSLLFLRLVAASGPAGCGARCLFGPVLMTIVAVWAADVAAYLIGSSVGRRKIAPRVSPGKTWEGTVAGFVAAGVVVIFWNRPFLGVPSWAALSAILIGPAAFGGDLLESWVKRRAGVKDSGTLLPGHGGALDRIDSLLSAAALVAGAILLLT